MHSSLGRRRRNTTNRVCTLLVPRVGYAQKCRGKIVPGRLIILKAHFEALLLIEKDCYRRPYPSYYYCPTVGRIEWDTYYCNNK
uniref:Uncharacterized protein n=1 Tax=Picea glauca TaxID=3330 RepID=A0A101LUW3_PICGL|nr:hypothetical protein ABT39_MTgene2358 [Picea glauca]QHR92266.1 hypothetical protein Q903MT_gene6305 [Picea sitchensis]